jgi:hypothetical protein
MRAVFAVPVMYLMSWTLRYSSRNAEDPMFLQIGI